MALTELVINSVKTESNLRAKLMLVEGKSEFTINRWIKEGNTNLTKPAYTKVICEHLNMPLHKVLGTSKATA